MAEQSYDQRQIGALLKQCRICLKWYWFVNHAAEVCQACR